MALLVIPSVATAEPEGEPPPTRFTALSTTFVDPFIAPYLPRSGAQKAEEDDSPVNSVEALVRAYFPDAPVMVRVIKAESQFVPTAKNPTSTAAGLAQILIGTWNWYECTGDRFDAEDNLRCARKIFDREGTRPWNSSKGAWSM